MRHSLILQTLFKIVNKYKQNKMSLLIYKFFVDFAG